MISIKKIELFSGYLKLVFSDGSKLISSSEFINKGSKKYLSSCNGGKTVKVGDGLFITPLDGSGDATPVIVTKVLNRGNSDLVKSEDGVALEVIPVGSDKPEIFLYKPSNGFFLPGWIRPDGMLTFTFDAFRVLAI